MRVVTHHRPEDPATFQDLVAEALAVLAQQPGFVGGELGRSPDEAAHWLFTTRWHDVGSMRRGMGGFAAKLALAPVMASAADAPSVFEILLDAGSGGITANASDLAEGPQPPP